MPIRFVDKCNLANFISQFLERIHNKRPHLMRVNRAIREVMGGGMKLVAAYGLIGLPCSFNAQSPLLPKAAGKTENRIFQSIPTIVINALHGNGGGGSGFYENTVNNRQGQDLGL